MVQKLALLLSTLLVCTAANVFLPSDYGDGESTSELVGSDNRNLQISLYPFYYDTDADTIRGEGKPDDAQFLVEEKPFREHRSKWRLKDEAPKHYFGH